MEIQLVDKNSIKNITNYNLSILDEAIRQTELKVQDESRRKGRIDTRCYSLLTLFVGAATLLFSGLGLNIFQDKIIYAVLITGLMFGVAIFYLLQALKPRCYGGEGVSPNIWLQESILTGDDDMKGYMLTNILLIKQDSILTSSNSNDKRLSLLRTAIKVGVCSPLPLMCYAIIYHLASFQL